MFYGANERSVVQVPVDMFLDHVLEALQNDTLAHKRSHEDQKNRYKSFFIQMCLARKTSVNTVLNLTLNHRHERKMRPQMRTRVKLQILCYENEETKVKEHTKIEEHKRDDFPLLSSVI